MGQENKYFLISDPQGAKSLLGTFGESKVPPRR